MGLTEEHWFEGENELNEHQLERALEDERRIYDNGYKQGQEDLKKQILEPTPSYPPTCCGCGCGLESSKYKEDCYFYGETQDMGAIIRFCTREEIKWGYCPCEKCDRFLSKEEVDKVARSMQEGLNGKK